MSLLDDWERVFSGDGGDYQFTMSRISIGGRDVDLKLDGGQWVLTQRPDGVGGTFTARSESKLGAVLLLIAARGGLASITGTSSYTPDPVSLAETEHTA